MSNRKQSHKTETALQPAPESGAPATIVERRDDGDRVQATIPLTGGMDADIRARDIAKGASSALRGEIRAVVRGQRYAALVAEGVLALSEVPDASRLDALVELRRRGLADGPAGDEGDK